MGAKKRAGAYLRRVLRPRPFARARPARIILPVQLCSQVRRTRECEKMATSGAAICIYDSVIRGHHVYKVIWTPYIGEMLLVRKEPANSHDGRAVAIVTSERTVVGHVPTAS